MALEQPRLEKQLRCREIRGCDWPRMSVQIRDGQLALG
jgi:hypothetical protein